MRILDRYISRRFFGVLLFAILAFIAIFVVVDLIENLDKFIEADVPRLVILQYYINYLPFILVLVLPIAMLISTLFSIGNMARVNEVVAMKAAGLSLYRILLPLFIIALLMSVAALGLAEYLMPPATTRQAQIKDEYLEKNTSRFKKRLSSLYVIDDHGRRISMRLYNVTSQSGTIVSIRQFDGDALTRRLDARKMVWEDSVWVLYDGYERTFDATREIANPFEEFTISNSNIEPTNIERLIKKPEEMSYFELEDFILEVERNGSDPDRWLVDLYLKIAVPFANFIMVLFGAPLSARKQRGGAAKGFGISLTVCFIYFGIVKTTQTMGHNGNLDPFLAAWFANVVFGVIGLFVLLRAPK